MRQGVENPAPFAELVLESGYLFPRSNGHADVHAPVAAIVRGNLFPHSRYPRREPF